jgi:hypothetical protein
MTTTKPKLVAKTNLTFHSNWLEHTVAEYFVLAPYDPATVYDTCDCYYTNGLDETATEWLAQGRKVVVDCLWETAKDCGSAHVLSHPNWFWYQESLWYRHLGYHEYQPNKTLTHAALMPIRLHKPFRQQLVSMLGTYLDNCIWSYQAQGRNLPNDREWDSQRYFNPEWYDSTCYSICVESFMHSTGLDYPFVTEKTFKPIAFQHPFLVAGNQFTLAFVRKNGFETFENLFDESYDVMPDALDRLIAVRNNAVNYKIAPYDTITKQKLEHNYQRFFDSEHVRNCFRKQILEPLLHYAET